MSQSLLVMTPTARRLMILLLAGTAAITLAGCATSSDDTWIHPDTGTVPVRSTPQGG